MKKQSLIFAVALGLALAGCGVRDPVSNASLIPILSRPSAPDSLRLGDPGGMAVSVAVTDPQGAGDIETIRCEAFRSGRSEPVFQAAIADDGEGADILPADGTYSGRIRGSDLGGIAGDYTLRFTAVDRSGNAGDPVSLEFRAVTGGPAGPPVLLAVSAPDTIGPDRLAAVRLTASVSDPEGAGESDSVFCDIYPPYAIVPSGRVVLAPAAGPAPSGDGPRDYMFEGDLSSRFTISGVHRLRFEAKDQSGRTAVPRVEEVLVLMPNDPPVLGDASAPATVDRNSTDPIVLSIRVTDPQGPADVRRVYFNTTKPDGKPSSGNPFLMTDDGTSGDAAAGDGVYSLQIVISSTNALGDYRFDFYAEDTAGATAGPVTRVITVVNGPGN
jgi:hypothetical protein